MFLEICGFEKSVAVIETAFNLKLCLLVQGTSIWILLIMSCIRDVITGQLDVTPQGRYEGCCTLTVIDYECRG